MTSLGKNWVERFLSWLSYTIATFSYTTNWKAQLVKSVHNRTTLIKMIHLHLLILQIEQGNDHVAIVKAK